MLRLSMFSTLTVVVMVASMMCVMVGCGRAEHVNNSASGGLFWSTVKEEGDLVSVRKAQAEGDDESPGGSSSVFYGDSIAKDEFDAGFSSLDGMLQWAIGHSDPATLRETAQDVQHLSPDELKKCQMKIQQELEKLKMPSDAQLMKTAIDDLNNSSLTLEDHYRALEELLILVEPIHNANDMHKLNGLAVVIRELTNPESRLRAISAWILGKACQNNPVVQKQVLELGALAKLMKMVKSSFIEEATKALYAVSSLIRNNLYGQELFYTEAGDLMLQDILSNSSVDVRLRRKSVSLVADLAECQLETNDKAAPPLFSNHLFLKSVVDLTASTDLDLQEKALFAIKNILQLRSTEALIFKDFCGLDEALERMRQQLQQLMVEGNYREYALDVESLCREVAVIFLQKLDKGKQFQHDLWIYHTTKR